MHEYPTPVYEYPTPVHRRLYTVEQTADLFGVSTKTITRLIQSGHLPYVRIGRCIRVPQRAILDWIESQTRYNLEGVETTCASTGEKPWQSLNVVMEEVESTVL